MSIHMVSGYSLETFGAKVALEKSQPMIDQALSTIDSLTPYIIDYGIADGGTALDFHSHLLTSLYKRNPEAMITFIGNDLPGNPHHELALNLEQLKNQFPELIVLISPVSFYHQAIQNRRIDLGFSATAMHWLSQLPRKMKSHIHANQAAAEDKDAYRQQALDDFKKLMLLRTKELKSGGQLVLVNLAEDEQGRSLGKNDVDQTMFDYMKSTAQEMISDGVLPEEFMLNYNFQNYYKTREDFEEVLASPELSSLKLVDHKVQHTACPYRARYNENGNSQEFGEGLMKTIRSWSRHALLTAAQQSGVSPDIANDFYQRLQDRFTQNPEEHSMDYIHSYLHLEKK
jgi:hypothetical protein